jgi:hypothetical protein
MREATEIQRRNEDTASVSEKRTREWSGAHITSVHQGIETDLEIFWQHMTADSGQQMVGAADTRQQIIGSIKEIEDRQTSLDISGD